MALRSVGFAGPVGIAGVTFMRTGGLIALLVQDNCKRCRGRAKKLGSTGRPSSHHRGVGGPAAAPGLPASSPTICSPAHGSRARSRSHTSFQSRPGFWRCCCLGVSFFHSQEGLTGSVLPVISTLTWNCHLLTFSRCGDS